MVAGRGDLGQIELTGGGTVNLGLGLPAMAQLPVPVGGILATGLNIGGTQVAAGSQIFITALPQGFALPPRPGVTNLPAGASITFPNRPEFGQLTLSTAISVDLSAGLPAGGLPMVPTTSLASPIEAMLTGRANIGSSLMLPGGAQVLITGLPQNFVLPQTQMGVVILPPGATLMVPVAPISACSP